MLVEQCVFDFASPHLPTSFSCLPESVSRFLTVTSFRFVSFNKKVGLQTDGDQVHVLAWHLPLSMCIKTRFICLRSNALPSVSGRLSCLQHEHTDAPSVDSVSYFGWSRIMWTFAVHYRTFLWHLCVLSKRHYLPSAKKTALLCSCDPRPLSAVTPATTAVTSAYRLAISAPPTSTFLPSWCGA
jgi:hypothetical protein